MRHFVSETIRKAKFKHILNKAGKDRVFAEAHFIAEKGKRIYGLDFDPSFLPNPINVPDSLPERKSTTPSITFVARWDVQKRVDIALQVATALPQYDFYFIGTHNADNYAEALERKQRELISKYSKFNNIHILGFVGERTKYEVLSKSWVLLNTSVREGLPITFLEAGAYQNAIVSHANPDGWADRFGLNVQTNDYREYMDAIRKAISEELYNSKGKEAYRYVKEVHEENKVAREHIQIYQKVMS
jgi:glycosyltransferase involved in cell wall biosynthesis